MDVWDIVLFRSRYPAITTRVRLEFTPVKFHVYVKYRFRGTCASSILQYFQNDIKSEWKWISMNRLTWIVLYCAIIISSCSFTDIPSVIVYARLHIIFWSTFARETTKKIVQTTKSNRIMFKHYNMWKKIIV